MRSRRTGGAPPDLQTKKSGPPLDLQKKKRTPPPKALKQEESSPRDYSWRRGKRRELVSRREPPTFGKSPLSVEKSEETSLPARADRVPPSLENQRMSSLANHRDQEESSFQLTEKEDGSFTSW